MGLFLFRCPSLRARLTGRQRDPHCLSPRPASAFPCAHGQEVLRCPRWSPSGKTRDGGENTDLATAPHGLRANCPCHLPWWGPATPVPGMMVIGGQGRWEGGGLPTKVPPHMQRHLQTARRGLWVLLTPLCHLTLVSCHPGLELHPVPPPWTPTSSLFCGGPGGMGTGRKPLAPRVGTTPGEQKPAQGCQGGGQADGWIWGIWVVPVLGASRGDRLMVGVPGTSSLPHCARLPIRKVSPTLPHGFCHRPRAPWGEATGWDPLSSPELGPCALQSCALQF